MTGGAPRPSRRAWARARWLVLPGAGLLAVALGTWGLAQVDAAAGDKKTVLTHLYQSLSLFGAQGADVDGDVPWALEVARFLAPLVLAGAALGTFLAVSRREADGLRARLRRGHLVVVGAGPRAVALALDAQTEGGRTGRRRPVLVAADGDGEAAARARTAGLVVVEPGAVEGTEDAVRALRRAGVARAEVVTSLAGDLATDARVAAAVVRLHAAGELPARASSFVEVDDVEVARRLESQPHDDHRRAGQEFFNAAERAARAVVAELDLGASPARVLVVGDGDLAACLAAHLARRAHTDPDGPQVHLTVARVGPGAAAHELAARLRRWYPRVDHSPRVRIEVRPFGPDDDLTALDESPTLAVVALDDEAAGAHAALSLLSALPAEVPVLLCSAGDASIGALVDPVGDGRMTVVAVDQLVLREASIRAGSVEAMARATHERYRRAGTDAPPWSELDEAAREDNRLPVRELWRELAALGYRVVGHTDVDADEDRLADDPRVVDGRSVRDVLARAEHERWYRQRVAQGYTWGPKPGPRTRPCLKPWDDPELPDPCRAQTYEQVDDIPRALAAAGLQLRPRPREQAP